MEEDQSRLTKRILDLTLEIVSLLTGETFTVVKSGDLVAIMAPQHHFVIPKRTNKQKLMELINKMTELLTGESGFRRRCVCTDKEELEEECGENGGMTGLHSEEHKPAMTEDQPTDGSRSPHPLYSQETAHQHQGDRLTEIKAEAKEEEARRRGERAGMMARRRGERAGMMARRRGERAGMMASEEEQEIKGEGLTEEVGMRVTMKEEGETSVWGDRRPREGGAKFPIKEEEASEKNGEGSGEKVGMRLSVKEEEASVWGDERTREAIKEETEDGRGEGSAERLDVSLTYNEDEEDLRPLLPSLEDIGVTIKQGDMFWAVASDDDISKSSEGRGAVSPPCQLDERLASALPPGLHSKGSCVNMPTYVTGGRGEKLSVCQDCGECFTSRAKYHSHRRVHSKKRAVPEERKAEDGDIGRESGAERSLDQADPEGSPPEIVTPAGDTLSVCQDCGECFGSRAQYHAHRTLHRENRLFPCSQCGKSFKRKIHLANHLDSHNAERPFTCLDCGKSFPNQAKLTVHQRAHTRNTILTCPDCSKHFTLTSQLNRHRKRHSGDKPFSCTRCTYRSAYKCDLALHLRFHTQ